jgi:hypothetical protein
MHDDSLGRYVSEYLDGSEYKKTKANTVQALFPLLIEELPLEHKREITAMLRDVNINFNIQEKHYKSDYPIPSVSRSDPAYQPVFTIDLMWRGPSWAAPNFFVLEGLKTHN